MTRILVLLLAAVTAFPAPWSAQAGTAAQSAGRSRSAPS